MLATAGTPPAPSSAWAYELKWDGQRAITHCDAAGCRLWSRNLREATSYYPDLAEALTAAIAHIRGEELMLDGEIVAPDPETGAPSFSRLQQRMHATPTTALLAAVRAEYVVFDVLADNGISTMDQPYSRRREILDGLNLEGGLIRVPPFWTDTDPSELLQAASDAGLEGIVSKRVDSPYQPGTRSRAWLKTALRRTTEGVIVGWQPGNGAFASTFGSLILAAHDHDELRFIGSVGTGFTTSSRRTLRTSLDDIARTTAPLAVVPPPLQRTARWVEPILIADVEYREFSADKVLRHPSFRGLRPDRTASEITVPGNTGEE